MAKEDAERVGCIIGAGMGGLGTIEDEHSTFSAKGVKRIGPFFIPSLIINLAPGQVSIKYGLKGPNFSPVSACATGNHSIGDAMIYIERGMADVMLTGGCEATITPLGIGGFCAARAMSERNDAPEKASRPFDKGRDGFVAGEGSGLLVLEEYEHAKKRGAKIYAELVGYGATADAYHITTPAPEGEGGQRAMKMALRDAGIAPELVGYVNTHGTSTPAGDIAECQAIGKVFGEHAKKGLMVSSTKSMTGHLLGAAGGLEAVVTVMAVARGVLPPTINVEDQDPECPLDVIPNQAREKRVDYAMSNSFGFGGTNAVVLFKRAP
jgi:3-oxoacyl-[acyl-carrier-protein] synthase II